MVPGAALVKFLVGNSGLRAQQRMGGTNRPRRNGLILFLKTNDKKTWLNLLNMQMCLSRADSWECSHLELHSLIRRMSLGLYESLAASPIFHIFFLNLWLLYVLHRNPIQNVNRVVVCAFCNVTSSFSNLNIYVQDVKFN